MSYNNSWRITAASASCHAYSKPPRLFEFLFCKYFLGRKKIFEELNEGFHQKIDKGWVSLGFYSGPRYDLIFEYLERSVMKKNFDISQIFHLSKILTGEKDWL